MDFDLTAEQRKRYDNLVESARVRLGSTERATPAFTTAQWQAAADLGMTGLCLPADHGGQALGVLDTALGLEAFARGYPDIGFAFAIAAHLLACAIPIRDFGTAPMRDPLLNGLAAGRLVAANAMTEDDAGSDVSKLSVTASRTGDGYLLDGEKSFVSNAPAADVFVTYAVSDPHAAFLGITAFAVPRDTPGLEVSAPFSKMGLDSCPAGRVRFNGCVVPEACRLGTEGAGSAIFQHSMSWERACLPAIYLGMMETQLDRCVTHARQRRQFDRPIGDNQAVSHRIATMRLRLEGARLLLYRGCWLADRGDHDVTATALAKIAVSEAAVANSLDAIQIFGGRGYLTATGIEQNLRDSVAARIFSGTNEIQRELVAREEAL
jgi:alkylation response protein AidB-like acyl-CoA dehydrogenase